MTGYLCGVVLGRTSDGERMSSEDSGESFKPRVSLLAESRKVAADARESDNTIITAESTRNLLLNLDNP